MANMSVRKIDDETYRGLRLRAARHGVSMEEEVRRILKAAVMAPERLGDMALAYFGPQHGVRLEMPAREASEPLKLGG